MNFRPSLLSLGFTVVGFPIVCLLVFISLLFFTLAELETKLAAEEHSTELVFKTQKLMIKTSDEFFELGVGFGVVENSVATFRKRIKQLSKEYRDYISELKEIPRHEKDALVLSEYFDDFHKQLIPKGSIALKEPERIVGSAMAMKGFKVINKLDDIAASEEAFSEQDVDETARVLNQLASRLYIALGFSIAGALLLWYFYSVSIERPLIHLIDNGVALGKGSELDKNLDGVTDAKELVVLDSIIHRVADSIDQHLNNERDAINLAVDLFLTIEEDGTVKSVNPYIERLLGYTQEDVVGGTIFSFLDDKDEQFLRLQFGEAIKSGDTHNFELSMKNKNGRFVETAWSCLHSTEHANLFIVVHDITEEKRVERLKADFSEMVSTDLKLPLTELKSSLVKIEKGDLGELSDKCSVAINRTLDNVDRLILLGDELLDFQKLRGKNIELDEEDVDVVTIVEDAVRYVEGLALSRKIRLVVTAGARPVVSADPIRILQTVVNLISNAVKYTPDNGQVEIVVNIRDVADQNKKEEVEILILDSGEGVPESHHEKIFQAFEQVSSRDAKKGTGLGLAICKLFVEAHGGAIRVLNENDIDSMGLRFSNGESVGSVFSVVLPK